MYLQIRFNYTNCFTSGMVNSIISIQFSVCIKMKWHVVYEYKKEK